MYYEAAPASLVSNLFSNTFNIVGQSTVI